MLWQWLRLHANEYPGNESDLVFIFRMWHFITRFLPTVSISHYLSHYVLYQEKMFRNLDRVFTSHSTLVSIGVFQHSKPGFWGSQLSVVHVNILSWIKKPTEQWNERVLLNRRCEGAQELAPVTGHVNILDIFTMTSPNRHVLYIKRSLLLIFFFVCKANVKTWKAYNLTLICSTAQRAETISTVLSTPVIIRLPADIHKLSFVWCLGASVSLGQTKTYCGYRLTRRWHCSQRLSQ